MSSLPQEKELKFALGGSDDFTRWSLALGNPSKIEHQCNFYFTLPTLNKRLAEVAGQPIVLRLRAICAQNCPISANLCRLAQELPNDTASALAQRVCEPRFVFTLKQKVVDDVASAQGYQKHVELESDLRADQIESLFRGELSALATTSPGQYLSELGMTDCKYLGNLHNTRYCYRRPAGEMWELDLTQFRTHSDCELEVETEQPERVRAEVQNFAAQHWQSDVCAQLTSKFQRFLDDLN